MSIWHRTPNPSVFSSASELCYRILKPQLYLSHVLHIQSFRQSA